jgi:hypothetical protein
MSDRRSDLVQEVQRLKEDLYLAREAILDLLPDDLGEVARKMSQVHSWEELNDLEKRLTAAVMQKAEPLSPGSYVSTSSSKRAYCPLCRSGSSAPYESGFALPDGLQRHLRGEGNTRRCSVTEALFKLSLHRLRERERANTRS